MYPQCIAGEPAENHSNCILQDKETWGRILHFV